MKNAAPSGRALPRAAGLPGALVATWGAAGGVVGGGMLAAALILFERISANGLLTTSTLLFVFGTGAGLVHGAVLGMLGRPRDMSLEEGLRSVGLGALYLLPAAGVSLVLALWISQTVVVTYRGRVWATLALAATWLFAAAVVAWAARLGWQALRNAYRRWPDPVLGTVLVGLAFAALLAIFLTDRPAIWGTRVRVGGMSALFLAGGVTVWISGPVISLPLVLWRRLTEPRPLSHPVPRGHALVQGVGAGVVAGAALAGLALWLSPHVPALGADGSLVGTLALAASRGLIDELLLRLCLLTCVVWVGLRWHPLHPEEGLALAVVIAALAQTALHWPGLLDAGLPSVAALWGTAALTQFVPGLVFGGLYLLRGLPAALAAHAVMLFAMGLGG